MIDLRAPRVAAALALSDSPQWFLDTTLSRTIGERLRATTRAQAMIVPSIALPDDLTRWNLVVFLDKLPVDAATWVTKAERVGPLSWTPS